MPNRESESRRDLESLPGRLQHFLRVMNPLHCLATDQELNEAHALVAAHAAGSVTASNWELRRCEDLLESSHHPDTGERIPLVGRMCFQAPGSALLAAGMLTFHQSTAATLLLQFVNQSYMAVCNWSNRNAAAEDAAAVSRTMWISYFAATAGSLTTAYGLKRVIARAAPSARAASIAVPMISASVANMINVPAMRIGELRDGITVEDKHGVPYRTPSRAAACYAVGAVTAARIANLSVDLMVVPLFVALLARRGLWWAKPCAPARVQIPLYTSMCFVSLAISTPVTSAIIPQRASIYTTYLNLALQEEILTRFTTLAKQCPVELKLSGVERVVFFNKGL